MGYLVAAYRRHPHHGMPISQEIVGHWAQVSQGQISKMETGKPERHIDRLRFWAKLLGIPTDLLWFAGPTAADVTHELSVEGRSRPRIETLFGEPIVVGTGREGAEESLVQLVSVLDPRGVSNSSLTAAELACERIDLDFARTPPDEILATTQALMREVSTHLRQPQALRDHERLVRLAARLSGLRAWACFDIDDHRGAERWYDIAVSAAHDAKAWGLGAWLLGAQSLIPWHRRDLGRAAELIDRGVYFAGHGSDATTRAWLHALRARAYAAMGNRDGFESSYAMAEESAEGSSERDRRHGMDFAQGILDLRYYCGTSRLLLRQSQEAVPELAGSLDALPESHTKARAVLTLFLADAAVQLGDPAKAVDLTQHALASTIHQPIVPILQQSRRIRRLVHLQDPAAGTVLNEAVQSFGTALAAVAAKAKS